VCGVHLVAVVYLSAGDAVVAVRVMRWNEVGLMVVAPMVVVVEVVVVTSIDCLVGGGGCRCARRWW
jgi:hypothetical protein